MKLNNMMRKIKFESPAVLKVVHLECESPIMAGSVVTNDTEVKTTGQQVEEYNFSDTQFNQEWE